jgi:chemotaxis protein MotB
MKKNIIHSFEVQEKKWLISFLDMISLIFAFFILIFSMSDLNTEQLENTKNEGPFLEKKKESVLETTLNAFNKPVVQGLNLDYLNVIFQQRLKNDTILKAFKPFVFKDRFILSLPDHYAFEKEKATLSQSGKEIFAHLLPFLINLNNRVSLECHTDVLPHSEDLLSPFEYTLKRSLNVLNILREGGYDQPIIATGKGDSHFQESLTFYKQLDFTRRIDIVIYPNMP